MRAAPLGHEVDELVRHDDRTLRLAAVQELGDPLRSQREGDELVLRRPRRHV